jgi:hypothetical protein
VGVSASLSPVGANVGSAVGARVKDEIRIFAALFKGVSTQFGPRTIEKCREA